jgi:hypothetical protein
MPKLIDAAVKERALRMFKEHRQEYHSNTAQAEAVRRSWVSAGDAAERRLREHCASLDVPSVRRSVRARPWAWLEGRCRAPS